MIPAYVVAEAVKMQVIIAEQAAQVSERLATRANDAIVGNAH